MECLQFMDHTLFIPSLIVVTHSRSLIHHPLAVHDLFLLYRGHKLLYKLEQLSRGGPINRYKHIGQYLGPAYSKDYCRSVRVPRGALPTRNHCRY